MKRFIWLALSLILLLPLVGCTDEHTPIVNIDWVDFIKFNDIMYLQEYRSISVNESNLSPYGEIIFKIADNVNDPNYKAKNGDAAYLEAGTPVFSLTGYSPYFRLVARENQELLVFEADTNPNAKKGSDLLDIGGKVEYIGINSKIDGITELASIKERTQVDELVQLIFDAPVDQVSSKTGSEQYFLEFHLKDGTVTKRSFWLDTGVLQRGIQLPEEFGQVIMTAFSASTANNNPTTSPAIKLFRSEQSYLSVQVPDGWASAEGPEYLAHPFEGQVSFNSWGDNDFWAREVRTDNADNTTSFRYSTQTVMSQIPEGGAYVALVRIYGPPSPMPDASPEYTLNNLGELYQAHDWRQDSAGAQFFDFYKWGRDLRLEVACRPDASDETVAALNDLLSSWRFDSVPVDDIQWAVIQARKFLPEAVEPLKFSHQPGSYNDNGVQRIIEAETKDDNINVRFTYKWNNLSHWWVVEVSPSGEAVLTGDGGDPLPFD